MLGAQVPGVCSWEGGAEKKLREDGEEVVAKPEKEPEFDVRFF